MNTRLIIYIGNGELLIMKRVKLIENVVEEKHHLLPSYSNLMNRFFPGCKRIGAIPAKYYSGMGDRIELYDLDSQHYIGAIYPDGASMIWPMCWYKGNRESFNPNHYKTSYSDVMNGKKIPLSKRVKLIDNDLISKRKIKIKRRVLLNV